MQRSPGKRLFGTDGIRGVAGEFPLDERTVGIIGKALVDNLTLELGRTPSVVIGRDTRESGPVIERALRRGAEDAGARVESAGVITTPGVAFLTRLRRFDAGVVISASHNPYRDNGIKVFAPTGKKLADDVERRIEQEVSSLTGQPQEPNDNIARSSAVQRSDSRYHDEYIDYLVDDVGRGLRLDGLRIGVDCANGAASAIAPLVFERLGAFLEVISAEPDGRNINEGCGSLHQEAIQQLILDRALDLGVAFDGDADRALFVDARGQQVDGDQTMLILATRMKALGTLAGDLLVSTVMSNLGFEVTLRERGIELVRAQVGDRYVLEELLARGGKLGGEQSGHIIMPDISLSGDGIITALELIRAVRESDRTIGELASEMKRFPQILVNVRVRSKPPLDAIPGVAETISRVKREMGGRGRLLVRYSGTENLARVMIEGEDQATIEEQANRVAEALRSAIG
jgi:phosphoglucosamine mutase